MDHFKEKELLISEIEENKEDNKLFTEEILRDSIRIVLQTAVTGFLLGLSAYTININSIVNAISIIFSTISLNISTYVITDESYFEVWSELVEDIRYKYNLNIEKKELKRKLETLMLNEEIEIDDFGGKSNAK